MRSGVFDLNLPRKTNKQTIVTNEAYSLPVFSQNFASIFVVPRATSKHRLKTSQNARGKPHEVAYAKQSAKRLRAFASHDARQYPFVSTVDARFIQCVVSPPSGHATCRLSKSLAGRNKGCTATHLASDLRSLVDVMLWKRPNCP